MNRVAEPFWLSDVAHEWIKRGARREDTSMTKWIEEHYPEWMLKKAVIKDKELVRLIEERQRLRDDPQSRVGNNDKRVRRVAPGLYDGVVWNAMFGSWDRQRREFGVSKDCVRALAEWMRDQELVQRRAAGEHSLASQALELLGRGWTEDRVE